jgi:hypothetical protein
MRGRLPIILVFAAAMVYQSCDSTLNIDKPKDFYKYIGNDGDQTGVDVVLDKDGNAYILGTSRTASDSLGQQLYVVMSNPGGQVVWSKTYGDKGDEVPKDIELLTDGSLMILGDRSDGDFVLYRLAKESGKQVGPTVINGSEDLDPANPDLPDHGNSITQTLDGFIVAGYTDNGLYKTALVWRYDANMVKFPSSWSYKMSLLESTNGYDVVPIKVIQKDANTFFTFGYTNTPGSDGNPDHDYFIAITSEVNDARNNLLLIAGPDPSSNERLTSIKEAPVQSGGGFILAGYTSAPNSSFEDLYVAHVVQDPTFALASNQASFLVRDPKLVTTNLVNQSGSVASIYPSVSSGFYILANEGVLGDNNLYLTKLNNDLSNAWGNDNPSRTLGGVGDDSGGAVAETNDGRILVVGTMVLGDLKGQRKVVLMNLNSDGMFGN